eukprot:Rmarinus@m.23110
MKLVGKEFGAYVFFGGLLHVFLLLSFANANDSTTSIGLSLSHVSEDSQAREFAALLAVDMLNSKSFPSPFDAFVGSDFEVELVLEPTSGTEEGAIYSILDLSDAGVIAVIGEQGSHITEVCAYVSYTKSLPIVAPVASSPTFSDFPLFSRIIPSDVVQASLLCALFNDLGWSEAAVISSYEQYGKSLATEFEACAGDDGINIRYSYSFSIHEDDYTVVLEDLVASEASVVVLATSTPYVQELVIQAYRLGIEPGTFVFVGVDGWTTPGVFSYANESDEQTIGTMLIGSVGLNVFVNENGTAYQAFEAEWGTALEDMNFRASLPLNFTMIDSETVLTDAAAYTVDAVLVLSHALKTMYDAEESFASADTIDSRIHEVELNGLSGSIRLDENGDREGDYNIYYVYPNSTIFSEVGMAFMNGTLSYEIDWPRGSPPVALPCPEGFYYSPNTASCEVGFAIPDEIFIGVASPIFVDNDAPKNFVEAYDSMVRTIILIDRLLGSLDFNESTGLSDLRLLERTNITAVVFDTHGDPNDCERIGSAIADFESDGKSISGVVGLMYSRCVETFYPMTRAVDIPIISIAAASPVFFVF